MKLHEHFFVLHQAFRATEVKAGLPALASALDCSERNVAVLLEKMANAGWIHWTASRGRGRFSTLLFLLTPQQVRLRVLSDMLSAGDLEKLVPTLDPLERSTLASNLIEIFRRSYIDPEKRKLQLPLFRPLLSFNPATVFLRVERHIASQLFSRLTEFDQSLNRLAPGLAHHWESDSTFTRWDFWIRPNIACHDGSELTVEAIRRSVLRLRDGPGISKTLFSHLHEVELCGSRQLAFHLTTPDTLWAHRLSTVNASIVPFESGGKFPDAPVGTGPFSISYRGEERLTLSAFRHYYRERALLDEIDLLILPPETEMSFDLQFGIRRDGSALTERLSKLFNGCIYLIFNPQRGVFSDNSNRFSLVDLLTTELNTPPFDRVCTPAHGLLPGWEHLDPASGRPLNVGNNVTLRIASSPRPLPMLLTEVAQRRLQQLGMTVEVTTIEDHHKASLDRSWMDETDVYICSEILSDNRDYGCYEWLAEDSEFRHWLSPHDRQSLDRALLSSQQLTDRDERVRLYEGICKGLVRSGSIVPIAHERIEVEAGDHVGGISRLANGFVPFAELWIRRDRVAAGSRSG